MTATLTDPEAEFDRQVAALVQKGYPAQAGLPDDGFVALVDPLRAAVVARGPMAAPTAGRAPFLLVVGRGLASAEASIERTTLTGSAKPGIVDRNFAPGQLARFTPIGELGVPGPGPYLAFDVERGEEFVSVTPDDATAAIQARGRTPITIDEGIAFITHFPEALEKNKCFSLAGSRSGDRRVPALWISQGAPKLGWCWAGNPHTWLGTASAAARAR